MAKTLTYVYKFVIPDQIDLTNCGTWVEDDILYIRMPGVKEPIEIEGEVEKTEKME
jgi:hypothetical protein